MSKRPREDDDLDTGGGKSLCVSAATQSHQIPIVQHAAGLVQAAAQNHAAAQYQSATQDRTVARSETAAHGESATQDLAAAQASAVPQAPVLPQVPAAPQAPAASQAPALPQVPAAPQIPPAVQDPVASRGPQDEAAQTAANPAPVTNSVNAQAVRVAHINRLPNELLNKVFDHLLELNLLRASRSFAQKLQTHRFVQVFVAFTSDDLHTDELPKNVQQRSFILAGIPKPTLQERMHLQNKILASSWFTWSYLREAQKHFLREVVKTEWQRVARDTVTTFEFNKPGRDLEKALTNEVFHMTSLSAVEWQIYHMKSALKPHRFDTRIKRTRRECVTSDSNKPTIFVRSDIGYIEIDKNNATATTSSQVYKYSFPCTDKALLHNHQSWQLPDRFITRFPWSGDKMLMFDSLVTACIPEPVATDPKARSGDRKQFRFGTTMEIRKALLQRIVKENRLNTFRSVIKWNDIPVDAPTGNMMGNVSRLWSVQTVLEWKMECPAKNMLAAMKILWKEKCGWLHVQNNKDVYDFAEKYKEEDDFAKLICDTFRFIDWRVHHHSRGTSMLKYLTQQHIDAQLPTTYDIDKHAWWGWVPSKKSSVADPNAGAMANLMIQ